QGALPWPNPHDGRELNEALSIAAASVAAEPRQEALSLVIGEEPPTAKDAKSVLIATSVATASLPAEELFRLVRDVLSRELMQPRTDAEVAELLAISKPQARAWLVKLVKEGVLEKTTKPIRYRSASTTA